MRKLMIGIVSVCLALGSTVASYAQVGNWFLTVKRGPDQASKLELLSEERFSIELEYRLSAWTKPFHSFTTRPKTIHYHLLTEWDGVSFDSILEGEIIGRRTAPGLKEDPLLATINTVTLRDKPILTAPFVAGDYWVSGCLSKPTGAGELGSKAGGLAATRCSNPVKLEVSARPRPDLVTRNVRVRSAVKRINGPDGIIVGDKLILSAEAFNAGDERARFDSMLRFFQIPPSANRDFVDPDNDPMLAEARVPRLREGGSKRQSITLEGPPSPGDFRYAVCVDPIRGVGTRESNPDNNCSRPVTARVQRSPTPCVDLTVESVTGLEGTKAPLERYSVNFVVKNIGNRDMTAPGVGKIQRPGRVTQNSNPTELLAVDDTQAFTFEAVAPEPLGPAFGKVCAHTKQDCNPRNDCLDIAIEVEESP